MDNRIFNVNGRTKEQLSLAVNLLLTNEYGEKETAYGWYLTNQKGIVLTWHENGGHKTCKPFTDYMGNPKEVNAEELTEILWKWLQSEEAQKIECVGWDADADHDGSNERGWRLFTEAWGHVEDKTGSIDHYSIAAFKPAYLWYGK